MSYSELLQQHEWIEKSASIIQRDSFKCQKCGSIGFHSMSMCICKDSQELDGFFDGWTFNGLSISTFLERERRSFDDYTPRYNPDFEKCYKSSITPIYTFDNDEGLKINGYGFYRISSMGPILFDSFNRNAYFYCKGTPQTCPVYQRHFFDMSENNAFSKALKIKVSINEDIYLEYGHIYVLDQNIVDEYIVSIEYIYPTGPNGIVCDFNGLYGSVIVSVTYKNFVGSFYFIPKEIKGLNVHHKYYVKGKAPWEYEDDALVTLCEECHRETHRTTRIPIYRNYKSSKIDCGTAKPCSRCNGSGYLPQYQHVADGICFQCWGEGVVIDDL